MSNTIQCDIVSSQAQLFSGEVTQFVATGAAGELGIHPGHAPLMTTLTAGMLRFTEPGGEETMIFAAGGILEVMPHLITCLVDYAVRAEDLDEAAAKRAREEAERALGDRTASMDLLAAEMKLAESLAQLKAVELVRRKKIKL